MNYENEIWKEIEGYNGIYEVSNYGRVRSLKRKAPKILKQANNGYGYLTVTLNRNAGRTTVKVHTLVAKAFLPNPNNLPTIDHINKNRADNRVENLRWANYQDQAKDTKWGSDVKNRVICVETEEVFDTALKASEWIVDQGLSVSAASEVAKRIRTLCRGTGGSTAYGYHWEFYYGGIEND